MKCTSRTVMLCSDCIEELETVHQYNVWKWAIEGNCVLTDAFDEDIAYLEKMGCITSSEISRFSIELKSCKPIDKISEHGPVKFYCANHKHLEYLHD